jgi:hypothetical protein
MVGGVTFLCITIGYVILLLTGWQKYSNSKVHPVCLRKMEGKAARSLDLRSEL